MLKPSFALALFATAALWALDPTPLDLKTGEWEYTVIMQMVGMPQQSAPQMPRIPEEQLAKMPPEQRARIEQMLKQAGNMASGKPTTTTNKSCVRKEDLGNLNPMGKVDKSCTMTVVNSSHSKLEAKMTCDTPDTKTSSTMTIEALSSESSKFNLVTTGTSNGRPMNMTVNGTGKWLSGTCTD
jgi:hypothetical protein